MSLEQQMASLAAHFDAVKRTKALSSADDPVFALEHNLCTERLVELRMGLFQVLRATRRMHRAHWLGWVVHAAEHGYQFNGQEFWDSFADITPGWTEYGSRDTLRDWFLQFHRKFNGVRPSGRWSENYSYICWPVSNAIVPVDLQVQLAESMYNARYSMELASVMEPARLGALIARHTYGPTSRYEGFLQHTALAGRIVRALLQGNEVDGPIYRPTLERIAADISQIEHAHEWMHAARTQYGRDLVRMRHGSPRANEDLETAAKGGSHQTTENRSAAATSLLPRLTVRAQAKDRWVVDLAPPSLQALCSSRPELRGHVERAGYRIDGFDGQFPAAGLLLGQPHPRRLRRWPSSAQPLLQVIPDQGDLNSVLQAGCVAPHSSLHVFRLHDDGHGQFVTSGVMHPGRSYLIAATEPVRLANLGAPIALDCDGLEAALIHLPSTISAALHTHLNQAGLTIRRTVSVTPTGLTPRRWSYAGDGEWLTTEHPAFVLESDHDLNHYVMRLDDELAQTIPCVPGQPLHLLLPTLEEGEHVLSVQAYTTGPSGAGSHPGAACEILLNVRDPAAWTPGVLCDEAFVVDLIPKAPSLDDILSGRLDLHVEGERSRKVDGYLVLEDEAGNEFSRARLFHHSLPVTNTAWARDLSMFLGQLGDDDTLLAASRGYLLFESDALGSLRVPLHIPSRPVRWATKKSGAGQCLRLIDERSGGDYSLRHHTFVAPMHALPLEQDTMIAGIDVANQGGLYVLEVDDDVQAVVVDQLIPCATLDALRAAVDDSSLSSESDPDAILTCYRLWRSARACSASARLKQSQVARAIHQQLINVLCSERWMQLEQAVRVRGSNANWSPIEHAVGHEYNYAVQLTRMATLEQPPEEELVKRFDEISQGYHMVTPCLSAPDAWTLAVDPDRFDTLTAMPWGLVRGSSRSIAMIRGARLVRLCLDLERSQI